ncbi:hypothetical protein [Staphylococcus pettenkoferi]|uniref:Uncharacterized protein n=1 Tax=Staphylococcus pettenkoferi TaxID=170573 RepID=A0A9Q4D6P6_9STAP|nr:hypothetical protein [Staphylococcus pettenkoferi]MCY1568961.1 hypothetical protein [Staphylococcus pettenkoferi]MCY1594605.1 hypothetical protein [Staphylococcus pettenkoferi]MCY1618928.1 hypothetical protein [Staphylococcus pettenkoferi]
MKDIDNIINNPKVNGETEESSAAVVYSYDIENALAKGIKADKIKDRFKELQNKNKFPPHLEYIDSHVDRINSTCVSLFYNHKTEKALVAMPGTNWETSFIDGFNDMIHDALLDIYNNTNKDVILRDVDKQIKSWKQDYDINIIAAHSLDGSSAQKLGAANHIPYIFNYNSAATYYQTGLTDLPLLKKLFISEFLKKINRKNYLWLKSQVISNHTQIFDYHTKGDFLLDVERVFDGVTYGKRELFEDDGDGIIKDHSIENFLKPETQEKLRKQRDLLLPKKKDFQQIVNETKKELSDVEATRARLISSNGGVLTETAQKYLDDSNALAVANHLKEELNTELDNLIDLYNHTIGEYDYIWNDGLEDARDLGSQLDEDEILGALEIGGVTKKIVLTDHKEKLNDKKSKVKQVKEHHQDYIKRLNEAVETVLAHDQSLASQVGFVN